MNIKLTFLGAAGTVTGSKYLVEAQNKRILVDCGLFQGERSWREKNWEPPPIELSKLDAVLITHAHIDHTGMLPRYYRLGLKCPIYCTKATYELSTLLLPDSGYLQEEEVAYRARTGRSRHQPILPLYTEKDAKEVLELFKSVPLEQEIEVVQGVKASWRRMGHIIGACSITLQIGSKVLSFSGDIGRYNVPILKDPQPVNFGDLLLIESTYGDRLHDPKPPQERLASIINATVKRKGVVLIPSFAVGRAQLLLYYLRELKESGAIPNIPVIVDSPMASDATNIYTSNSADYDEESLQILRNGRKPFILPKLHFVRDSQESKALNSISDAMIIISASGMLSGGRVLHHLRNRISNPQNTLLFVGHQPKNGRGDWIKSGAKTLRVFGEEIAIRAQVEEISGLSAHADRDELLRWCKESKGIPGRVAVVHGDPEAANEFCEVLKREMKWNAFVAKYKEEIEV